MTTRQAIVDYCNKNQIRIIERPSGAVRFVGENLNILVCDWRYVTVRDLIAGTPAPKSYASRSIC